MSRLRNEQFKSTLPVLIIQTFKWCRDESPDQSTETSIHRVDMLLCQGLRYGKEHNEICATADGRHPTSVQEAPRKIVSRGFHDRKRLKIKRDHPLQIT